MGADDDLQLNMLVDTVDFRVDRPRRQIAGLIMPWGRVATDSAGMGQWQFSELSLWWTDVGRVKLLRDHDVTQPVGRAVSLDDREDGLYGVFQVARGPAGDEVLSLAEDGVLDGFSAGMPMAFMQWHAGRDGVRVVESARLAETTITALPAFDDARVLSVNASMHVGSGSYNEEMDMPVKDEKGTPSQDEAVVLVDQEAALRRFDEEIEQRFSTVTEKLTEAFEGVTAGLVQTHEKIVSDAMAASFSRLEGPSAAVDAEFSAARIKVVSEPPVYRFEGGARGDSLVRDFWRAQTERDHDAIERLRRFQSQQRDMVNLLQRMPPHARAAFDINRTSGAPVIPPGYRPDLFVNELSRERPIVSQVSRGTITDATPFTVPRFVSATGSTADHVEGTNPTEASMTMDSVTVTPGAVSGRFDLTREIVDAANPAIDAIALANMRESYNRQTEQKAYAELNIDANVAVNTTISLAALTGGTPAAERRKVVQSTRDLLARYPFTRFASPTGGVMGQLVTVAMANAVDTSERPLLPSVGGQNTYGLGNAVDQGWSVDGLVMRPAWAMTQAVGDEAALILNSTDVWAWESPLLTFRFEEKQGPAVIELALFAYFATKVLRPAGIFSLRVAA